MEAVDVSDELRLDGAGACSRPDDRRWDLRRNCCLAPSQLGRSAIGLALATGLIAAWFWSLGYPLVALFAGLEMIAFGAALLVYARHACDRETLTLSGGRLCIERAQGGEVERVDMSASWLRVALLHGDGLIELSERERTVLVGRHLNSAARCRLAKDIRQALAQVRA